MQKSFPTSYPYLNNRGLIIQKRDIDRLSEQILYSLGHKGLDFGVELAYIMLWAIERSDTLKDLENFTTSLFKRTVYSNRRYKKTKYIKEVELTGDLEGDVDTENKIVRKMDAFSILETSLAQLALQQRSRDREKTLKKLKTKFEGD